MEKQMVIAYIGNGKSANRYHIPFVLTRKDKIRIKKIYTMDHSRDKWAEIPGVQYVEDMDEILKDDEIQVVILSTPHDTHYPLAKKVLEAGKLRLGEALHGDQGAGGGALCPGKGEGADDAVLPEPPV